MLERKITAYLEKWLNRNTVVLVEGVRQAGKSYAIREFGRTHFGDNFFEFNFHEHEDVISGFNKCQTAQELITNLSFFSPHPFISGKTLIFLDEIQLINGIDWGMFSKYLVTDGRFRFALSGSLLGITLNGWSQNPAAFAKGSALLDLSHPGGYLDEIRLYPMDFEEYLWANGLSKDAIQEVRECFLKSKEVPPIPHTRLIDLFYEYLFVGGYPDAVASYLKGRDLQELRLAHERIDKMHKRDVTNHAEAAPRIHLVAVYESLSGQINAKNKRFKLNSIIGKNERYDLEDDFQWLAKVGLAYPVYNVTEPTIPLRLNEKRSLVKLFESDVGMLTYHLFETGTIQKLLAKEKDINYGSIFENSAAELLSAHGFDRLYYYDSKKHGEVDFVLEKEGEVLPLEIKSGKDYKIHHALTFFMSSDSPYLIKKACVFSNAGFSQDGNIFYFPIYFLDFLSR
jgi:predicted AAA+ superfamily ATPase